MELYLGLVGEAIVLDHLSTLPGPADLLTPIASIAIGLALLEPRGLRIIVVPLAVFLAATAAGIFLRLTDPSLHDPAFSIAGTVTVVWLVLALGLSVRAFRQSWFDLAGRILGSWLLAIGLLHGGAVIAQAASAPAP